MSSIGSSVDSDLDVDWDRFSNPETPDEESFTWGKLIFCPYVEASRRISYVSTQTAGAYRLLRKLPGVACLTTLMEIGYVTAVKAASLVRQKWKGKPFVPDPELKTSVQRRYEELVPQLAGPYSPFCSITARFIDNFIPHLIAGELTRLPVGFRTQMSYLLLGKASLGHAVNFEHLLLDMLHQLSVLTADPPCPLLAEAALKSLSTSLARQKSIEAYLTTLFNAQSIGNVEEQFIARLAWHSQDQSLPEGLPDPNTERLTTANLQQKLDESLNQYLYKLSSALLSRVTPDQAKGDLFGFIYTLKGKSLSADILTFLIAEMGIKPLVDPHLLALTLLKGSGITVMRYNPEGFGREACDRILTTGKKMIGAALEHKGSKEINTIFADSGLRVCPEGLEAICQRKEIKEKLRRYIASTIYELIKPEEYRNSDGFLKALREKFSRMPIVGSATVMLHLLINGAFFSTQFLFLPANLLIPDLCSPNLPEKVGENLSRIR